MKLVDLVPLKEMASRRAQELADSYSLDELQFHLDQIYMDMEQEAEPEGGPIADQYADEIHAYDEAIRLAKGGSGDEMTYDQAIAKHYGKSPIGARPGGPIFESKEKWDALDVSRKAEKGLDNKEWNERTAKKLTILKGLNSKGAFKKDWDEEKLQGWVDQNYSWEKITKQFKNINEMKRKNPKNILTERFQELAGIKPLSHEGKGFEGDQPFDRSKPPSDEFSRKRIAQDSATIKKVVNLKMDSEIGEPVTVEYKPDSNLRNVTISWGNESHTVDFDDVEEVQDHGNEGKDLEAIANSDDGRWQFILDVYAESTYPMTGDFADWDFDELIVQSHPDDESHLEPEDRFDQDPQFEGLWKGIKNVAKAVLPTVPSKGIKDDEKQWNSWSTKGFGGVFQDNKRAAENALIKHGISKEKAGRMAFWTYKDILSKIPNFSLAYTKYPYKKNTQEGSCGYTQTANGKKLKTPGGTRGVPANVHTITMMREFIKKEIKQLNEARQALQVTTENGVVAIIEDPTDIEAYDRGNTVIGTTAKGEKIELNIDWSSESHMVDEGMSDEEWADAKEKERLEKHPEKAKIKKIQKMMREAIRKEITKLHEKIDHSGKTCAKAHPDKSHTAWERIQK